MTPAEKQKLIEEAFLLGFMVSREGFNAECSYPHCANGLKPHVESEADFRTSMELNDAFVDLRAAAVARLQNPTRPATPPRPSGACVEPGCSNIRPERQQRVPGPPDIPMPYVCPDHERRYRRDSMGRLYLRPDLDAAPPQPGRFNA